MQNKIIDNENLVLLDQVKDSLSKTELAKFAVGYFFISGFKEIYKDIENIDELQLLIGNSTDQKTCEQLAEASLAPNLPEFETKKARYRGPEKRDEVIKKTANDFAERISQIRQTDENKKFIDSLRKFVQDGKLKIKIYTKGRLHAKCYIMYFKKDQKDKGEVIVGSSNLSLGGLKHNSELNVVLPENYLEEINNWFEKLWGEAEDFSKDLINIIENSWAEYHPTPYELYLKVIYEIVKDKLNMEKEEEDEFENTPALYNYQRDAVIQAKDVIERYNGVFISDVVGLGKTYIGSRILHDLCLKYNEKALVICPPNLKKYWQETLDEFSVPSYVESRGYENLQKIINNKRLMKRKYVLIDESHYFRNSDSKSYRLISQICFQKKVILVTATPQNLDIEDIQNQLKIFHPQNWTDIPIDPPRISDFFIAVKNRKRSLDDLLRHILIRRTRKHIKDHYKKDLEKSSLKFPERANPERIPYSIEKSYGQKGMYKKIEDILYSLTYARYNIFKYSKKDYQDLPEFKLLKTAYENLKGLMKILFFKELESSVHCFRFSIDKLIKSHELFLDMWDKGVVQTKQSSDDMVESLSSNLEDEEVDKYFEDEGNLKFKTDQFQSDFKEKVKEDLDRLLEIRKVVKNISPEQDEKLIRFKEKVKELKLKHKKILVFTQFTQTAKYLFDNLQDGFDKVGIATGSNNNLLALCQRFSPGSFKDIDIKKRDEIDILISTDVLSEGVNLQDCDVVINYDLHWNPVRLIQRLGRIDRVSTKHNWIYNYNFFPEKEVEARLGLKERVESRIREIMKNLGEDAKYLSKHETISEKSFYQIYTGDKKIYEEDETQDLGDIELVLFLRDLKEENPILFAKISNMQKRLHTAKKSLKKEVAIFCKADEVQAFYLVDIKGQIISRNRDEVLKAIKCDQKEPTEVLPTNFNMIVNQYQDIFEEEMKTRIFEIESKEADPVLRFIFRDLGIIKRGAIHELKNRINKIHSYISGKLIISENAKRELNSLHRRIDTSLKEEYISELEKIIYATNNTAFINQEKIDKKQHEIYTEVIASEGLV